MDSINTNDNGGDAVNASTEIQQSARELDAVVERANKKNAKPADVAALRSALKEHPNLWRLAGDLAQQARAHTLQSVESTPAMKESVQHGLREMKRELGYADAPLLERLLIEQVLLCWLRLNLAEYQYTNVDNQGGTFARMRYWEQRLTTAQVRYLRAIEALARIRKLARPTPLQVNIGGQQVIAAGDVHAGRP